VQRTKAFFLYCVSVSAIALGIFLVIELGGWLVTPQRYQDPPPVTADAWIFSDALTPHDTTWMREYVDEFCASYKARWTSYVYFKRVPFSGHLINVDSNGIRLTPQFRRESPAGTLPRRIFLFGGSTMWGTCARDSGTIPSCLARILASHPEVGACEVTNMGESGYVSTQSVIRLMLELRSGNIPAIILLYDGVNEVFSAQQNNVAGLPQNEMNRSTEFNLLKEQGRMRRLGWDDVWKRTVTAGIVNSIRSAIAPSSPPLPARVLDDVVKIYRENLNIIDALSKQYGFRYEAYWQPVLFVRTHQTAYQRKESERMAYARPLFLDVYRRVEQDSALAVTPHFHNIGAIFDSIDTPVYLDFCHTSETGNTIIAQRMYQDIAPLLSHDTTH
jgi:lysophospholipase L1-like esterase